MNVRDFDFDLPAELIAQEPAATRSAARLLHLDRATGAVEDTVVNALPGLLDPGDLLVVNNTRVFPARLLGRRLPGGGRVECLLVERIDRSAGATTADDSEIWHALMHPGQRLHPGALVVFDGVHTIHGEVLEQRFHGRRTVRLWTEDRSPVGDAVEAIGHTPLPPYIKRSDRASDRERYQTVFARERGSVAAPTAGLHFDRMLLASLDERGIERVEITLHVGYGTFQPVRVERVEDHHLDAERYHIDEAAATAINQAVAAGRRVVAVGTTTTRTLETVAAAHDGMVVAGTGSSDLFISPGFTFRIVQGLFTNFHLPRSSLLMLVTAFGGFDRVMAAYRSAVASRYRFYSYGDAMLIT